MHVNMPSPYRDALARRPRTHDTHTQREREREIERERQTLHFPSEMIRRFVHNQKQPRKW